MPLHSDIAALFDLTGQLAVITGGARHLGYDAASILAAAGADVVVTSRTGESAVASAASLAEQYGVDALGLELHHERPSELERVHAQIREWKGDVDILVNNAGGGSGNSPALLFRRDPADIAHLLDANLTGVILSCREFGRAMAERRRGSIINIASMAGLVGRDRRVYKRTGLKGQPVEYAAAKAGVIGLTMDLAGLLSPSGVRVNAISPGGFERGQPEAFIREYSDRTPLGRMGHDGVDLKGAILFLASPASGYVTGHNLVVDGGFSIWK